MVFRMTARREKGHRNAVARVHVVIAAAVVLAGVPVRVVLIVVLERRVELSPFGIDDVAELRGEPARSDDLKRAGAAAGSHGTWSPTDHVDVDLRDDRVARHRGMV